MRKWLVTALCLCLCLCGCSSTTNTTTETKPGTTEASAASSAASQALTPEEKKKDTYTEEEIETAFRTLNKGVDEFHPGYATYKSSIETVPFKKAKNATRSADLWLYINTDPEGHVYPCAAVEYKGKSWIFFEKLLFLTGDDVFTVSVKSFDKTKEVKNGAREKYTWVLSDEDIAMFEKLIATENRKLKLQGKDDSFVYEFSDDTIAAITEILDSYRNLTEE